MRLQNLSELREEREIYALLKASPQYASTCRIYNTYDPNIMWKRRYDDTIDVYTEEGIEEMEIQEFIHKYKQVIILKRKYRYEN